MANYSGERLSSCPTPENRHEFKNCNFAQLLPHTTIFDGITGLKFISCNLMNCDLPEDVEVEDCLTIHKNFCSNHKKYSIRKL